MGSWFAAFNGFVVWIAVFSSLSVKFWQESGCSLACLSFAFRSFLMFRSPVPNRSALTVWCIRTNVLVFCCGLTWCLSSSTIILAASLGSLFVRLRKTFHMVFFSFDSPFLAEVSFALSDLFLMFFINFLKFI